MLTIPAGASPGALTVGVVGAGLMGRALAAVFAGGGHSVRLFDVSEATLAEAVASLAEYAAHVRPVGSLAEVAAGAAFVTEAVREDLSVKQAVFHELAAADSETILATNTSVLPVTAIAAQVARPERVVGTHWWNPPGLIPVVEVVRGHHTSTTTMDTTVQLLCSLGKLAVRVERDVPGFVGNRMQHALWREAIAIVAEGIADAETVDLVVRNTIGLRLAEMGPLENADFVGLDLTLAIHEAVLPAIDHRPGPSPLLRDLVAAGRLGAKSGSGFLTWEPGDRERAGARLAAHVRSQLTDRAIRGAAESGTDPKEKA
mgnify:FL=1